jgi:heme A synthase
VADNQSVARAVSMALHLVNTFFLLAALAFTGWWATGGPRVRPARPGPAGRGLAGGPGRVIFLGMSGAVTALGDTLFPAGSLAEGIRADFEPTAHFLVRMRIWHPVIAVIAAAYIVPLARTLASRRPSPLTARLANLHVALFVIQLVAGGINVVLLAPVWMQLVHLALACAVWLSLVLLGASAFSVPATGTLPEQIGPIGLTARGCSMRPTLDWTAEHQLVTPRGHIHPDTSVLFSYSTQYRVPSVITSTTPSPGTRTAPCAVSHASALGG